MSNSPLTDTFIKNLKESGPRKYFDGGGLYLYLTPTGSKLWRMSYRFDGKPKTLSFGSYPIISLKDAREKRAQAKKLLAENIDPNEYKKVVKEAELAKAENTFTKVATEWFQKNEEHWADNTCKKVSGFLKNDILPFIGDRPVNEISAQEMLQLLKRVEARGVLETAHRILQYCGQIFRYAVITGRANQDVTAYLKGALKPVPRQHHASITDPRKVGQLLRDIDAYEGSFVVKCALKLLPIVFLRPGELRNGVWSEFDFNVPEWRIPESRMKMGEQHIIPLSRQALEILEELKAYSGEGKYLFPGTRSVTRPMSDNALNAALRRMGYTKDEMCAHGFRSMASTLLNELGYNRDWIERQLAHGERNQIRAAYNFAEFLPERRRMMQEWADYLDALKK